MITPRRTRLVRVPDLPAFRRAIVTLSAAASPVPVVLVPTAGAGHQLQRTLDRAAAASATPLILTRDELYDLLHTRLPGACRRLSGLERATIMRAAAATAAQSLEAPFSLRPGLVAEMLRFYDQLRRQSHRLTRFNELIEETLGGGTADPGTDKLLAQTRFLSEAFVAYEALGRASGAWDEHALREHLVSEPTAPILEHVIVTLADWIADPDGLFIGDFDLLARMPGLQRLDLVCTERVLGSGFHERLHDWWPGLEETTAEAATDRRPMLEVPRESGRLWFAVRDREEELARVAQHVKARRRSGTMPALDAMAVVYKRPLPYLYLAARTLGAAGVPFQTSDAMPLASEPYVAALDLVLAAAESGLAREALTALLACPYWVSAASHDRRAIRRLDQFLQGRGYLGELAPLEQAFADLADETLRALLTDALEWARVLAPLREPAPASVHVRLVATVVAERLVPPAPAGLTEREDTVRSRVLRLLSELADAHASHHDPVWTIEDVAPEIRRWIEEQTGPVDLPRAGMHLLDDRAARYAELDDITLVGLIESEWPERQARSIFYPSGLLRALGWPSEHTRRRAADARFVDLLGSAREHIAVSTVTLDDDAIVARSMQLDEIERARLSTVPSSEPRARLTAEEALCVDPPALTALSSIARTWAEARLQRPDGREPAYHGTIGERSPRAWSVSALETYQACPFKFFAQHILRLEDEPEDSDVMDPRKQGQFVHRVFERFFDRWRASGGGTITAETLGEARDAFSGVVEDEVRALPEAEAGLERTRLLGSAAAAGLGEAVLRMEAERPIRVIERLLEHRLDGPLDLDSPGGTRAIPVRGKADRIDLLEDGTFRLIDYKLGWPPQRSRALQLPIYALAAERQLAGRHGRRWTIGEAAYLAFKGPRRVVSLISTSTDTSAVLLEAQRRVVDVVDAITRGEFPPRPDDVFLCESCSFQSVCRKDYVGDV